MCEIHKSLAFLSVKWYTVTKQQGEGVGLNVMESAENYLEAILIESKQKEKVRAVDICARLGFSRPTVSVMLKSLREKGYLLPDDNASLLLSEAGRLIAENTYERHCVIAGLLMRIGVSDGVAYEDACRIEHDISEETFQCMKAHLTGGCGRT